MRTSRRNRKLHVNCLNQHSIMQGNNNHPLAALPGLLKLRLETREGQGLPPPGARTGKGHKAGLGDHKRSHLHHPRQLDGGTGKTELLLRRKWSNSSAWLKRKQEWFIWHYRSIQHLSSYALTASTVCLTFISCKCRSVKKEKLHLICWVTPRQKHCWGNCTNTFLFSSLSSVEAELAINRNVKCPRKKHHIIRQVTG